MLWSTFAQQSHHGLGGNSKLINRLRAASSGAFVCWRPNLSTIHLFILLHEKFLQFGWLGAVKYLHVKMTNFSRILVYSKQIIAWFVRNIWDKYHSWYFKVFSNFTRLTVVNSWYLCQISLLMMLLHVLIYIVKRARLLSSHPWLLPSFLPSLTVYCCCSWPASRICSRQFRVQFHDHACK